MFRVAIWSQRALHQNMHAQILMVTFVFAAYQQLHDDHPHPDSSQQHHGHPHQQQQPHPVSLEQRPPGYPGSSLANNVLQV